ncbi:MAG: transglycosylase SLT domain-containing protein [Paramuribaculum sp.]|nr:transglycosylase SLT domain-containing protein [Paramuribaculum sp.]
MSLNTDSYFRPTIPLLLVAVWCLAAVSCHKSGDSSADAACAYGLPDTLRVVTLYSPGSFFYYKEMEMGYDYDLIKKFTADKHIVLDLKIAPSLSAAVAMLDSGKVDLVAYEVPVTSQYKAHVIHCGVENITTQVLVQPKTSRKNRISDVTQLVGREVYVERDSKYHHRLINLNEELGGGVIICNVDRDTLITEDLIAMVSRGEIPLTIVDSDIARINKTYYSDLDITLPVSFPQRSAWGVSPHKAWLADSIDGWFAEATPQKARLSLLKRYFELSKASPAQVVMDFSAGRMSAYDDIFKRHAASIDWDWRLLSAMGFVESRYDTTQVSWAGAKGIMQLMPRTAQAFGLTPENITHPDDNILAATKVLASLDKSLSRRVPDPVERQKFVVAGFNSGLAHILDAIALAEKYGYNPQVWDGAVAEALLLKSNPEYYNDPVVKYGYFRASQTYDYVRSVYRCYAKAKSQVKL